MMAFFCAFFACAFVKDLQLEISSRKSGGWKVISDGETK